MKPKINQSPDVIISVRLPREMDAELTRIAAREDRKKSAVIRIAVKQYLEREKKST